MKSAPILENENERLQTLLDYQVLDSAPELEFDDITLLASSICQTPIALISLIDENRQWFKSKVGLGASETPRDISFCGHAIHGKDVFIVPDSFKDIRFSDNPLATGGPHVRFYAGAPLIAVDGNTVGTLCVIDSQPRELSEIQKQSLSALSRQVIGQLELRKSNRNLIKAVEEQKLQTKQLSSFQEKLFNNAKMASLGEMASGMAHEINNPLAIISGNTNFISSQLSGDLSSIDFGKVRERLATIQKTVERISKIIKSLKSLSRNSDQDPKSNCSSVKMIEEVLNLCQQRFKMKEVVVKYSSTANIDFQSRPSQIVQVLLNLLNNAFDAIELTENPWIEILTESKNGKIIISISNSGPKIPKEVQNKMMQPFYTTKGVGKGTGLGLSICLGLIENQGGKFYFDDEQPNTTFVIELPIT